MILIKSKVAVPQYVAWKETAPTIGPNAERSARPIKFLLWSESVNGLLVGRRNDKAAPSNSSTFIGPSIGFAYGIDAILSKVTPVEQRWATGFIRVSLLKVSVLRIP